jgi:putative tryptophan/tyrosine transport system substrate-binding protein
MRESCTYGSVRGASSNGGPYRNRREFIAGLGGVAAWPVVARAQQPQRMRRIGVFMNAPSDDPIAQADRAILLEGLQKLGWAVGRNVQIEWRWYMANADLVRRDAEELAALAPDVIVTISGPILSAMVWTGTTMPVVFAVVADPVGAGYVTSLARPGRNITGFASIDYSVGGKLLELLKEITPGVTRALVFRPATYGRRRDGQFDAIQRAAPAMGLELWPADPSEPSEIERAVTEFAREPNGGLIVTASAPATVNRKLIIAHAAKHLLPAVYPHRGFPAAGGLISYGAVRADMVQRTAGYVDRILKGEKPADLPVQQPTKFELVINLKTAKALGLTIPETLLATADEVIQ